MMHKTFEHVPVDGYMDQLKAAQERARAAVAARFPAGTPVYVHHYHGIFHAEVACHCGEFWAGDIGYLLVRNFATGKTSKRHYRDLELA